MNDTIRITQHAQTRMAQRGIRLKGLIFCLDVGEKIQRTGAIFYVLTDKCLSKVKEHSSVLDTDQLRGLTAIIEMDYGVPYVATVYKNRQALRHIRRKCKTDKKKQEIGQ
ncbi:TPA: hypothetical protein DCG86_00180 [Candidatus Marinimicrobia bacterium]|nr:hypothetical protein [Candidatus Neomarinimicrobiota bacterium]